MCDQYVVERTHPPSSISYLFAGLRVVGVRYPVTVVEKAIPYYSIEESFNFFFYPK